MADKEKKSIRKTSTKRAKKPASKYEEKLVIHGSFEELVKELVTPKQIVKSK